MALEKSIIQHWRDTDIVLLGGSAGSFKLFYQIVKSIDPDINKAIVIVMHRKKNYFSEIEKLFSEHSRIYLKEIADKDVISKNAVYLAPANYHTLFENEGYFSLDVSEAVWYSKPSIDVTFESAADIYGERCAAILVSGANQDGAEGLLKIKSNGGLAIVQDPRDAEMAEMPQSAIDINAAGYILSTAQILELIRS
ncbi:chemotaxis protein CheB [Mucilaginibacter limnophilus]|uniref:protein-glutamate methylesterase n=1 Tax=Mucilaginibacter limnophilus TaxID=1932778 RepID=A0A437MYB4_9SPHI|nr:chemotaxis protein CheB [Mucilaginibacter limnophilus]RVU02648.1 chemotaxis protein CheB [Mucilaginibacter limnophilus]